MKCCNPGVFSAEKLIYSELLFCFFLFFFVHVPNVCFEEKLTASC